MRLKTVMGSIVAGTLALSPVAAQAATAIGTVSGHGDVLVARDGKLVRVGRQTSLFAGDRVVTRSGGSAQVAINGGCTSALGQSAMLAVSANCAAQPIAFDRGRAGYQGRSSGLTGSAVVIAVLAAAAVAAGVVAAVTEDNNASTSP